MLTSFIEMEFLKLKRSKIFLITLLGCLTIPFYYQEHSIYAITAIIYYLIHS